MIIKNFATIHGVRHVYSVLHVLMIYVCSHISAFFATIICITRLCMCVCVCVCVCVSQPSCAVSCPASTLLSWDHHGADLDEGTTWN